MAQWIAWASWRRPNTSFDYGVFKAVVSAAPYPPPPVAIRSSDGLTYLRWTLNRGESQCGTWNAEPYILGFERSEARDERVPRTLELRAEPTAQPSWRTPGALLRRPRR
jgi:hypothetical protein